MSRTNPRSPSLHGSIGIILMLIFILGFLAVATYFIITL